MPREGVGLDMVSLLILLNLLRDSLCRKGPPQVGPLHFFEAYRVSPTGDLSAAHVDFDHYSVTLERFSKLIQACGPFLEGGHYWDLHFYANGTLAGSPHHPALAPGRTLHLILYCRDLPAGGGPLRGPGRITGGIARCFLPWGLLVHS